MTTPIIPRDLFFRFKRPSHFLERVAAFGGSFCHVDVVAVGKDNTELGAFSAYQGCEFQCYGVPPSGFDTGTYTWVRIVTSVTTRTSIMNFLTQLIGSPYNLAAWIACPLNAPALKSSPGSWFCSEVCAEVLGRFLVDQNNMDAIGARPPSATSPNRFFSDLTALGFEPLTAKDLGNMFSNDGTTQPHTDTLQTACAELTVNA
jgi:hypothetical protein